MKFWIYMTIKKYRFLFGTLSLHRVITKKWCTERKMKSIFEIFVEKTIFNLTVDIRKYSMFKNEDEIILQAASVLEVIDRKVLKNNVNHIRLKLIPNKNLVQNFKIIKNQINLLNAEWRWLSGKNKEKNELIWQNYTPEDNFLIEFKYQEKEKECELKDHMINFEFMIQYRKGDEYRIREIQRNAKANFCNNEVDFTYFKILIDESVGKIYSPLTLYWYSDFIVKNKSSYLEKFSQMIQTVCDGILLEGDLSKKQANANQIATDLLITALDNEL